MLMLILKLTGVMAGLIEVMDGWMEVCMISTPPCLEWLMTGWLMGGDDSE